MPTKSKTDWERVKREAAADTPIAFDSETDPYDPNDADAVVTYWSGATVKRDGVIVGKVRTRGPNVRPTKEQVAIRLSPDVLATFRATGRGWQTRMDEALREWIKDHSPA